MNQNQPFAALGGLTQPVPHTTNAAVHRDRAAKRKLPVTDDQLANAIIQEHQVSFHILLLSTVFIAHSMP